MFKPGYKQTEEQKRKISAALKRHKRTPEHSDNISKALKAKGYIKGDKNRGWRGGIYTDKMGYVYSYQPEHPYCDSRNYVPMHRLIIEKHIGRYLTKSEIIHHVDGARGNNKIENLLLLPNQKAHAKYHKWGKKGELNDGK